MSGVQALVRLPMLQKKRDAMLGLNTGRLHQRLPRLAARRLRPGAVAGQAAPGGAEHRLPARRQRGARGDRGVGHAAARPLSRSARSSTACSASGTARGPGVDRCSDVFKHANMAGTRQARRRDRHRRRRPHRQELDRGAPERPHLQGLRPAGVLPVERAGHPRHGPARLRDEPLRRRLVEHEDDPGSGRIVVERATSIRTASTSSCPRTSRCRRAACTSAGPTRRSSRKRG